MANSAHLLVRNRIKAALLAAAVAGGNVKPGRAWPMAEQDQQLAKVYLDSSLSQDFTQGGAVNYAKDWTTRVRCEFLARGTDADAGEDLADALLVTGLEAVMADPMLGGLAIIDLQAVAIAWGTDEAETSIGVAQCVFQVVHRTATTTIAA